MTRKIRFIVLKELLFKFASGRVIAKLNCLITNSHFPCVYFLLSYDFMNKTTNSTSVVRELRSGKTGVTEDSRRRRMSGTVR